MITPAGILLIPVAILSIYRHQLAVFFTLVSVPFFVLHVGTFASHNFRFPEVMLIALLVSHALLVLRERDFSLPSTSPIYFLIGYGIVCVVSVLYLIIDPLDAMTHAYNSGSLDKFALSPIRFAGENVSQLLLRMFTIGAIIGLSAALSEYDIRRVTRLVVVVSVFVGGSGVLYQTTQFLNVTVLWEWAASFGLDIMVKSGGILGMLPRMWTVAGEPGFTASYLLYAFSLTATLSFLPETRVLSRQKVRVVTVMLFSMLVLTTSATAYGGLLVFAVVFLGVAAMFDQISVRSVLLVYATLSVVAVLLASVTGILFNVAILAVLEPLIAKLQFQAGSGVLRLQYIVMAFDLFSQRPLFGIGVGSYFGASLLGTLLAETGIAGLTLFVLSNVSSYWECVEVSEKRSEERILAITFIVANATLLGTAMLAKSVTTLLFPWFWLSLALPTALSLQAREQWISVQQVREKLQPKFESTANHFG